MKYEILNPGGNKTALVFGTDYTLEEKKKINEKILSENLEVEQVGFLDKENKRLEMAGGEFCVNATRCAIWECLDGKEGTIKISVSGQNNMLEGGITKNKTVYAKMDLNNNLEKIVKTECEFSIVKLDGIVLLVMDEEKSKYYINKLKTCENEAKLELKQIMINSNIEEKAIGVILLEKVQNATKIYPIIWVKSIDTLYFETACGSGSLATAIYKYKETTEKEFEIIQPSEYTIKVLLSAKNNFIENAIIEGVVEK